MYEQKLWQDHVTEFEDRYTESRNDDGTIWQPRPFWDGAVFCFLRPPAPSAIIINLTCKRQGQSRRENLCNGPV